MIFGGLEKITLVDYPGKVACVVYTIGCNFHCPYCHNPELVDETVETHITEDEFFAFLDSRKKVLDGVVITGGEPTIHDDLPRVIKKIKDKGFLVKLDSNGTRPDMLRFLMGDGLIDYIAMDIKSPFDMYEQTVARPVNVDAIKESVKLLMGSSVEYEFRTTVVKGILSKEDILQIGKEIRGAKRYFLQKFIPIKILNSQLKRRVSYSDDELAEFQTILNNYVEYCAIR